MEKKKIKILTTGVIRLKGFINGPVLTPYYEDLSTIFALVSGGIKIVEVCDDGTEILLTTGNFSEDHSKAAREKKETEKKAKEQAAVKKEEKIVEPAQIEEEPKESADKVDIESEPTMSEPVEEVKVEQEVKNVNNDKVDEVNHQYNHNKKHNKHNKGYNNQQFKMQNASVESIDLSKK